MALVKSCVAGNSWRITEMDNAAERLANGIQAPEKFQTLHNVHARSSFCSSPVFIGKHRVNE